MVTPNAQQSAARPLYSPPTQHSGEKNAGVPGERSSESFSPENACDTPMSPSLARPPENISRFSGFCRRRGRALVSGVCRRANAARLQLRRSGGARAAKRGRQHGTHDVKVAYAARVQIRCARCRVGDHLARSVALPHGFLAAHGLHRHASLGELHDQVELLFTQIIDHLDQAHHLIAVELFHNGHLAHRVGERRVPTHNGLPQLGTSEHLDGHNAASLVLVQDHLRAG